jgi:hypothetical protein
MMRSRGTRTNAHSPFAQRQSAVGEAGCGDAPQPVKLAKTARINAAHIMVMSRAVVCVERRLRIRQCPGVISDKR